MHDFSIFIALALSFSPDGHELAVSTLDGNVSLWNIDSSTQLGTLECHRDMCEGKYKKNKQRFVLKELQ